ncbi:MAG: hypothetical protein HeimC3_42250 [Candidatus Heimdallarchaeota archaeon LC_3]|nr:MAG: hypothetical protein HeimC3_42250 [Candidatus Heimdallarchaeota archaeon LC_3]
MPITFGLGYDIKEEFVNEFMKTSKETLALMDTMQGHIKTYLYRDAFKPNSFLIYSEWSTNEDFTKFMTSKEFKEVQTLGEEMLEGPPRHTMYESRSMSRGQ